MADGKLSLLVGCRSRSGVTTEVLHVQVGVPVGAAWRGGLGSCMAGGRRKPCRRCSCPGMARCSVNKPLMGIVPLMGSDSTLMKGAAPMAGMCAGMWEGNRKAAGLCGGAALPGLQAGTALVTVQRQIGGCRG